MTLPPPTLPASTLPASTLPASTLPAMTFDHVGLVVKTLGKGRRVLAETLGIRDWTAEITDPVNGVILQFGRDPASVCYELLEPLGEDSPVAAALSSGRAILNHMAYLVPDLAAGAAHMMAAGCAPTAEPKPAIAYGGAHIQFFVTPLRFIIELIEAPDHRHLYLPFGAA